MQGLLFEPSDNNPSGTTGITAYSGRIGCKYTIERGEMSSPDVGIYVGRIKKPRHRGLAGFRENTPYLS